MFPGFARDETIHIAAVTSRFSIDNYTTTPTAENFIADFEKLIYHQEEPFQSASIFVQYKVYELAKQHGVTVILDGQGADEILAGYTRYYHWFWQELIAKGQWKKAGRERMLAQRNGQNISWNYKNYLAAYLPQVAAGQLRKKEQSAMRYQGMLAKDFVAEYYQPEDVYKPAITNLNDILYFTAMQGGLQELLRYADRNSMAHSREVRLPFLQHDLVQFIFQLCSGCKIQNGFTKFILRKSMNQRLPDLIVWRKDKVGFEPPQQQWMQHTQMQDYIHESRKRLVANGVLQKKMLFKPIEFLDAHAAQNFDWRYLCAAQSL